jgi:hypothetical protein
MTREMGAVGMTREMGAVGMTREMGAVGMTREIFGAKKLFLSRYFSF